MMDAQTVGAAQEESPRAWGVNTDQDQTAVKYRKGGGSFRAPGTDAAIAALTAEPATAAEQAKSKTVEPVTADLIVTACGRRMARGVRDSLEIGGMVYAWIQHQPERPDNAQFGREGAIEYLREKLRAAKIDETQCRIKRDLRCYHLVWRLGGAKHATGISISAVRHMLPLLDRETGTDRPELKPATSEACKILWLRMQREKLSAEKVRAEVLKLLPEKTVRHDRQPRSRQAQTVLRLIPVLTEAELRDAERAIRQARAALKSQPPAAIAG